MNPRLLLAVIAHDLRVFLSDRRAVVLSFFVPIGIASFFGLLFTDRTGQKTAKMTVAVADSDSSPISKKLVDSLAADPGLQVIRVTADVARDAVRRGRTAAALLIPKGFADDAARAVFGGGKRPTLTLLADPSKQSESQMVRGLTLQQVASTVLADAFRPETQNFDRNLAAIRGSASLPPAEKDALTQALTGLQRWSRLPRTAAAPAAGPAGGFQIPCELVTELATAPQPLEERRNANAVHAFVGMAVQGLLFFAIDFAMGIVRDRRTGILRRLRAAPVPRTTLLLGKALASTIAGLMILAGVFGTGAALFHLRLYGSVIGFSAIALSAALMVAAFGLLVASLGKTEAQSRAAAMPCVLGMSVLGGAWFPAFLFPAWLQGISKALPSRWAIDGFDAMTWRGLGLSDAALPIAVLLGFTIAFGGIAFARFRWE